MIEKEKYKEYIIESWKYATKIAGKNLELDNQIKTSVALAIFEKICKPLHYFEQDNSIEESRPTDKQIEYAKKLKIKDPERYTKKTLSKKIKEVLKNE